MNQNVVLHTRSWRIERDTYLKNVKCSVFFVIFIIPASKISRSCNKYLVSVRTLHEPFMTK